MTRDLPPTQMESSPGWDNVVAFYHDLIDQHGFDQKPMLDVVAHYSRIETTLPIYASTSHAALGISTGETYQARLSVPMVYIEYHAPNSNFRIIFQKRQGDTTRTKTVENPTTSEATTDVLAWLQTARIMGNNDMHRRTRAERFGNG